MLQAILNKSWRQHPTKQQLYGHLPLILKTIQVRQTRHAERCWRSKDELISNVFQWTTSHEQARIGWPVRTYLQQLCTDTGCSIEDLPGAMGNRDKWWERVRETRASSMTWWCWWLICWIFCFVSFCSSTHIPHLYKLLAYISVIIERHKDKSIKSS